MSEIALLKPDVYAIINMVDKYDLENFYFAKDHGAYVGCAVSEAEKHLFYFPGCDPHKDANWEMTCEIEFGYDDAGELISIDHLKEVLNDNPSCIGVIIEVSDTRIGFRSWNITR